MLIFFRSFKLFDQSLRTKRGSGRNFPLPHVTQDVVAAMQEANYWACSVWCQLWVLGAESPLIFQEEEMGWRYDETSGIEG